MFSLAVLNFWYAQVVNAGRVALSNLTENARLFTETRKLLGTGGKVLEVVEDEQEQAPEITAEFYPAPANGSRPKEPADVPPNKTLPPGNGTSTAGSNWSGKSTTPNNGNGSKPGSSFNQLRNEFLAAARRLATSKKQPISEVIEWASSGSFKYGDIGRMTEADIPRLREATDVMTSAVDGVAR